MTESEFLGRVESVLVIPPGNGADARVQNEVKVDWGGFEGDKHSGLIKKASSNQKPYPKGEEVRNTRQVSIVSTEEMQAVADDLGVGTIEPGWVRANLLVSGIPQLSKLPPGSRLHIGESVGLVVEGENTPCKKAGGVIQTHFPEVENLASNFPKRAIGKRGLVAWVEHPGIIRAGDSLIVKMPEHSVRSV